MKKLLRKLFMSKKDADLSGYAGFSDFFLRAPENVKKAVIAEAARKANEDQMRVFKQAQLKVGA